MDSASRACDEGYSTDIGVEDSACNLEISPVMTKYWLPICANSLKPHAEHNSEGSIAISMLAINFSLQHGDNTFRVGGNEQSKDLCVWAGFAPARTLLLYATGLVRNAAGVRRHWFEAELGGGAELGSPATTTTPVSSSRSHNEEDDEVCLVGPGSGSNMARPGLL
nr:protein FAR1-RELATED SEQUENCE 5-like [Ipomoea batatas]